MNAPSPARSSFHMLILLSLVHGIVDLSSGALIGLLPTLREHYGLTYTMIGTISLVSNLTSSLTQPAFGLLSDRSSQRWLIPFSLLAGGLGVAAIGYMPGFWWMLAAVVLSALGTASFHPEGANAAFKLAAGRPGRAMAIYSVGGNIGFALAPLYMALLLKLGGVKGTGWALVVPLALATFVVRLLPRWQRLEADLRTSRASTAAAATAPNWRGTVLLTLLVIVRSIVNIGIVTYIPFYWIDVLGNSAQSATYVQVMYMMAGVFGTLAGAPLADRLGVKRLLVLSFAVLLPVQFALPFLSGWVLLVCLFLAGTLVVTTFTNTLILTQQYMPGSPGLASGINLGLGFGMGGVGTLVLGKVADQFGIVAALLTVAALVPLALGLAAVLPPVGGARRAEAATAEAK
jgi:MFS transporter, FSR family, fosmidomycin resistance protein